MAQRHRVAGLPPPSDGLPARAVSSWISLTGTAAVCSRRGHAAIELALRTGRHPYNISTPGDPATAFVQHHEHPRVRDEPQVLTARVGNQTDLIKSRATGPPRAGVPSWLLAVGGPSQDARYRSLYGCQGAGCWFLWTCQGGAAPGGEGRLLSGHTTSRTVKGGECVAGERPTDR